MTSDPERTHAARTFSSARRARAAWRPLGLRSLPAFLLLPSLAVGSLSGCSAPFSSEGVEIVRSFETLTDWKLFQRGPEGTSDLPLPVRWRSRRPAIVEARIVQAGSSSPLPGFDWKALPVPLDAAPGEGSGDFVLAAVPQGGNYDVEVRLLPSETGELPLGTDRVSNVAVGDVFLAAGQSNMSGYSGRLDPPEEPDDLVHLFGNDYGWKRGAEPMDSSVEQVDLVSRDSNALHSLMLRFAKEIRMATGVPIAIVPAPLGGSSLPQQWQRDVVDPQRRDTLYGSSIHRVLAQRYEHPIRGLIWYQGETDVGRGTERYLEDLKTLVSSYRFDLGAPELFFGSCQIATSTEPDIRGWVAIQEAQRRYEMSDARSALVGLADLPRSDYTHLSVEGYKEAGTRLARAVLAGSYGLSKNLGPRLVSVSRSAGGISLEYDKPVTGGSTALFDVVEASGGSTVGVKRTTAEGSTVLVELHGDPSGELLVSYGFGLDADDGWIVATEGSGAALAFDRIKVAP